MPIVKKSIGTASSPDESLALPSIMANGGCSGDLSASASASASASGSGSGSVPGAPSSPFLCSSASSDFVWSMSFSSSTTTASLLSVGSSISGVSATSAMMLVRYGFSPDINSEISRQRNGNDQL